MMLSYFCAEVDGGVVVTVDAPFRGIRSILFEGVTDEQMAEGHRRQVSGELVQHAYSFLTADQREFLMTGMLPEEWNETSGMRCGGKS